MQGLFLGAGASYELGMPLVWELTRILKRDHVPETLRKMQHYQSAGSATHWSEESVELLISLLSDNDLHYEAVIGAIEVEAQRRRQCHQPKLQPCPRHPPRSSQPPWPSGDDQASAAQSGGLAGLAVM